jgi:HD-GYP domain-containing protein (c-di-GMP phosphodiesterase class II)
MSRVMSDRFSGLQVWRRGSSIETVASKAGEFSLLASGANMEIIEGFLRKDEKLTIVPAAEGSEQAKELYYLLEGTLVCDLPSGPQTVAPGDYIVVDALDTYAFLTATADTRFLYFTTQPVFHELSQEIEELMKLAVEVEIKDGYTAQHCLRIQDLCFTTGKRLGLNPYRLHLLDFGAYLHDLGKLEVPVEILRKPSMLTPEEWHVVKQHPTAGRRLVETTYLKEVGPIIEQHHERFDGSGYPYGLSGNSIALEAYIIAVADTFDAMTTDRPYRQALPEAFAIEELERHAGVLYPDDVVEAFVACLAEQN